MNKVALYMPFLIMILVGYFIFKYYNKNKFKNDLTEEQLAVWKKSRWGLYLIIPFVAIFDVINNNITNTKQNLFPTIINFFMTRLIIKSLIKKGFDIKYPKLTSIGVCVLLFFIQVVLGILVRYFDLF